MRIFIFRAALTGLILFSTPCFSLTSNANNSLLYQCAEGQMSFNSSNVESATVEKITGASNDYSITIKLNSSAAAELSRITKANIGKVCSLIFNKKVISSSTVRSSIGARFEMTGFSKEDADKFAHSIKATH